MGHCIFPQGFGQFRVTGTGKRSQGGASALISMFRWWMGQFLLINMATCRGIFLFWEFHSAPAGLVI